MTLVSVISRGDGEIASPDPLALFERLFLVPADHVDSIVRDGAEVLADATGAAMVGVFHYDSSSDCMVLHNTSETDTAAKTSKRLQLRIPSVQIPHLLEGQTTGATYVAQSGHGDLEVLSHALKLPGIQSLGATSIQVEGEPWGMLVAASDRPNAFTSVELRILEAAARWMGSAVRRAELAIIATEQARELSSRANAESLIVSVAHDFYNFLTPLTSRVELIRRRAGLEERKRDFQDANRAARSIERLTNMVSDLFDTQRLSTGMFVLRREPIDLALLVRATIEDFETGGIKVEVTGLRVVDVVADPKRIRQALENLLANAAKVTPKTGTLRVNVAVQTQAGEPVAVITVRDEGPGITPDMLPRLFVRFGAGSDSTGLGLGLYLAQEIALAHAGNITVETVMGEGSRFHLAIPIEASV